MKLIYLFNSFKFSFNKIRNTLYTHKSLTIYYIPGYLGCYQINTLLGKMFYSEITYEL